MRAGALAPLRMDPRDRLDRWDPEMNSGQLDSVRVRTTAGPFAWNRYCFSLIAGKTEIFPWQPKVSPGAPDASQREPKAGKGRPKKAKESRKTRRGCQGGKIYIYPIHRSTAQAAATFESYAYIHIYI